MRSDTSRPASPTGLAALRIAPLALLMLAAPARAQREDQGLQLGCAQDFFRLCASVGVDPNSSAAETCMNRNRSRLSPECRAAITDYDRRTGSKGGVRGSRRPQQQDDF